MLHSLCVILYSSNCVPTSVHIWIENTQRPKNVYYSKWYGIYFLFFWGRAHLFALHLTKCYNLRSATFDECEKKKKVAPKRDCVRLPTNEKCRCALQLQKGQIEMWFTFFGTFCTVHCAHSNRFVVIETKYLFLFCMVMGNGCCGFFVSFFCVGSIHIATNLYLEEKAIWNLNISANLGNRWVIRSLLVIELQSDFQYGIVFFFYERKKLKSRLKSFENWYDVEKIDKFRKKNSWIIIIIV